MWLCHGNSSQYLTVTLSNNHLNCLSQYPIGKTTPNKMPFFLRGRPFINRSHCFCERPPYFREFFLLCLSVLASQSHYLQGDHSGCAKHPRWHWFEQPCTTLMVTLYSALQHFWWEIPSYLVTHWLYFWSLSGHYLVTPWSPLPQCWHAEVQGHNGDCGVDEAADLRLGRASQAALEHVESEKEEIINYVNNQMILTLWIMNRTERNSGFG